MKLIAEGTELETGRLVAMARSILDIKSVSKFKPNALNSITTPDGRVYIELKGFREKDVTDILAADMLSIAKSRNLPDDSDEVARIRQFYEAGKRGMELDRLAALYLAWRDSVIKR